MEELAKSTYKILVRMLILLSMAMYDYHETKTSSLSVENHIFCFTKAQVSFT